MLLLTLIRLLRWILLWVFPKQNINISDLCHRHPNWCHMVNCVNSLDDWKVIVRVLFEDGKNEIERAQVLHVFHRDTKRTLILKGKTKEIHLHYLMWKL